MASRLLNLEGAPDWMREFFEHARARTQLPPPDSDFAFVSLGFRSYTEYLESKLWKKIRRRVLKRDGKKCRRCGGDANCVHHLAYTTEVFKGEADRLLASLCDGCHTYVEIDENGSPRSPDETQRLLSQHDPQAFPAPFPSKVGPRKKVALSPNEWGRMSAVQRANWLAAAFKVCKNVQIRRI